jgi:hypothetical protein
VKALLMALAPKKGKGSPAPAGGPEPDDADDVSEGNHDEARKLFVSAAKDGDWSAAFDAVMSCMGEE